MRNISHCRESRIPFPLHLRRSDHHFPGKESSYIKKRHACHCGDIVKTEKLCYSFFNSHSPLSGYKICKLLDNVYKSQFQLKYENL